MDTVSLLEKLANLTHHHPNFKEHIALLPSEVKNLFLLQQNLKIRTFLSDKDFFSDARTVAEI